MPSLSVVIPALNEEDGIAAVIEDILAVRPSLEQCGVRELEIIVVDDGSKDRTSEIVAGINGVNLIKHQTNRGYGAAIQTGFQNARGDLLAFLDADGTYPPKFLPELCKPILEKGADVVIGTRRTGTESKMPLMRRAGNTIFTALVNLLSLRSISDCASGMRVIRKEVLPELYPLPDGLNFTPVMSVRILHQDIKLFEVPITYHERVGRSKLSVVRDGLRFAGSIIWSIMTFNPARVLAICWMILVILALLPGLALIGRGVGTAAFLEYCKVFSLYIILVMTVSAVSLVSMGSMFNSLVSLFHKRPLRWRLLGKTMAPSSLVGAFGWVGLSSTAAGLVLGCKSLSTAVDAGVTNPLSYLFASLLLILLGMQMMISWLVVRVLEHLIAARFN